MRPANFTLFLVMALLSWQTRGFAQTPPPPVTPASSSSAAKFLDDNIKLLTRPEGVEVKFLQTVNGPSAPVMLTGLCVTAEPKKVHFALKTQTRDRMAQLKLLCDGVTFYRLEVLPESNSLTSYTMAELQAVLGKLANTEAERVAKEDVEMEQLGMHGFQGIAAMLNDLKRRMIFTDPVTVTIDLPGKPKSPVIMIEGKWNPEALELIAPTKKTSDPNQQDQRYLWNEKMSFFYLPRFARLYFDPTNSHLLRVELWGITEKQGAEKVLSSTDLQSITPVQKLDTTLFQPTAEELKYKRETIDLASAIKNRHQETINMLKAQQQSQKK